MTKRHRAALVILAEGSADFATGRYPTEVRANSRVVPVGYWSGRGWRSLPRQCSQGGQRRETPLARVREVPKGADQYAERRKQLGLRCRARPESAGLDTLRDDTGRHSSQEEPILPPRRRAKRWLAKRATELHRVSVRWAPSAHLSEVKRTEVFDEPSKFIPEYPKKQKFDVPHYMYFLGPPIEPAETVRTGGLYRAQRVWAALDLLLTCDTIKEARDATNTRIEAAGA